MKNKLLEALKEDEIPQWFGELELPELNQYLSDPELNLLLKHSKIISFSSGEIIFKQGKKTEGIYILVEGKVIVAARVMGQGITNIEVLKPGNFIGEISFIEKEPCPTSYIADSNVKCLYINNDYFEMLSIYFPETNFKILNAITVQVCGRLKRMHDKVTTMITRSDMTSLSFYGRVINSWNQAKEVAFKDKKTELEFLEKKPLFNLFKKEELEELLEHTILLEAPKNCKLVYESEKNCSCYIVLHGAVQSSVMHDNKLAKLSVIGPATLFASIACIDKDTSFTITFSTCEQAVLLKIPESVLAFIEENKPQLWFKLFNLICNSLVALQKSIDKLDVRLHTEAYNR